MIFCFYFMWFHKLVNTNYRYLDYSRKLIKRFSISKDVLEICNRSVNYNSLKNLEDYVIFNTYMYQITNLSKMRKPLFLEVRQIHSKSYLVKNFYYQKH